MLEGISTDTSLPLGRNINLENTKLIPDIVILDLDMIRIVMEHWVLRQLHTTLVVAIYTSSI